VGPNAQTINFIPKLKKIINAIKTKKINAMRAIMEFDVKKSVLEEIVFDENSLNELVAFDFTEDNEFVTDANEFVTASGNFILVNCWDIGGC
jgi:hypothetical protein